MSYTKANTKEITDDIKALSFVKSFEYVGRIELCGSSDNDVDILIELEQPIDFGALDDLSINEYILEKLLKIVSTIGEKDGTCYAVGYRRSGVMEWIGYTTKTVGYHVITNLHFITPDGIPIDIWWTMGKTAIDSVNHDYFSTRVKWRIEGGCP